MNKPLLMVLSFCLSTLVVHSSYASASISTRVKVVEDKVRVHDKKIKDIKAQQEALSRDIASQRAQAERPSAPASSATSASVASKPAQPAVKEKTDAEIRHDRAVAAAQAKKRAEAEARAKYERLAAMYRARYAYP